MTPTTSLDVKRKNAHGTNDGYGRQTKMCSQRQLRTYMDVKRKSAHDTRVFFDVYGRRSHTFCITTSTRSY